MAISRRHTTAMDAPDEYRRMLQPFLHDESGIKALQQFIGPDNKITREGMYLLEILNNIIQSNNGTEKVFQRIPSEVFGGLSEGGRRNVQAALIARTLQGTDKEEQRRVRPSGYTGIQEIIGQWAERDGSWSDTPERDLIRKGYAHSPEDDGSEARIFDAVLSSSGRIYKTIDFSHYSDFELMLDRIAIHNATFPEMNMHVEGFGMRDDTPDHPKLFSKGFVVIISQPKAVGTVPTGEEIEKGMNERFFNKSKNGFFYVSGLDNVCIADLHDLNAVMSPMRHLLVFDCEAFLKTFPTEAEMPERIAIQNILPDRNGKYNSETWGKILGDSYKTATPQDISSIIVELRRTGKVNGLIDGKAITMDNPKTLFRTLADGRTERYYEGDILVGRPSSFEKEHTWEIPELQYDERNVRQIKFIINHLMPEEMKLEEFLFNQKYVGSLTASYRGGGEFRKDYRDQLMTSGRIDGLVNNRYIVQLNPLDKSKVLVSSPEKIAFMLWPNNSYNSDIKDLVKLTTEDKLALAQGKTINVGNTTIAFNLDKGRPDEITIGQRKLRQTQSRNVNQHKKKNPGQKLRF